MAARASPAPAEATRSPPPTRAPRPAQDLLFEVGGLSLPLRVPPDVYAPSDDTELMASEALRLCSGSVLEVGCGSGAVSLALARANPRVRSVLGLDISPAAVAAARGNALRNGLPPPMAEFLCSDLFAALAPAARFDSILFNPPYLPTADAERLHGALNLAFDGGPDGLRTVRPFLSRVGRRLAPGGQALLLVSSLQPLDEVRTLCAEAGLRAEKTAERAFFFERLEVWALRA